LKELGGSLDGDRLLQRGDEPLLTADFDADVSAQQESTGKTQYCHRRRQSGPESHCPYPFKERTA
jgi:hypothetical protein